MHRQQEDQPASASFTTGCSVQRRKPSSPRFAVDRQPEDQKVHGRKQASTTPERRCTMAATQNRSRRWPAVASAGRAAHDSTTAATARAAEQQQHRAEAKHQQRRARPTAQAASIPPATLRTPIAACTAARRHEHAVERRPTERPRVRAEDIRRPSGLLRRIEDDDEMHHDQRHHQRRRQPLQQIKRNVHVNAPRPYRRSVVRRFRPAMDAVGLSACGQCCSHD